MNFQSFIGEPIFHKTLGSGIVTACDEKYISIRFTEVPDGIKNFNMPDIFFDPRQLLYSNSKIIKDYVLALENQHTCTKCKKYTKELVTSSGEKLCKECRAKMIKCCVCKTYFDSSDVIRDEDDDVYCGNCFEKTHFKCTKCGGLFHISRLANTESSNIEGTWCDCCAEEEFEHCSGCYAFLSEESMHTVDHSPLCPHCFEELTVICNSCAQRTLYPGTDDHSLCRLCETEKKYDEFVAQLDFENLVCHVERFESFKQKKTVTLMSRLRRSYGENPIEETKRPIDVLFLRKLMGDFVVMWNVPERLKSLAKCGCTLTELKQNDVWHILYNGTTVDKQILTLRDGRKFHVWEKPYELRAQTISDMNYGDRWEGPWLVHEGNKFGDASRFIIVGYIEK